MTFHTFRNQESPPRFERDGISATFAWGATNDFNWRWKCDISYTYSTLLACVKLDFAHPYRDVPSDELYFQQVSALSEPSSRGVVLR